MKIISPQQLMELEWAIKVNVMLVATVLVCDITNGLLPASSVRVPHFDSAIR